MNVKKKLEVLEAERGLCDDGTKAKLRAILIRFAEALPEDVRHIVHKWLEGRACLVFFVLELFLNLFKSVNGRHMHPIILKGLSLGLGLHFLGIMVLGLGKILKFKKKF